MAVLAWRKLMTLSVALMPLAGCGPLERMEMFEPAGFVPPRPHFHRAIPAVKQVAVTAESSLSKCNRALYLKSASSQEELQALAEKCRAIILSQPY